MTAIIVRGDAANLQLPDETVDLVVTSPPYFGLRSYTDGGEHYAEQIGDEATPAEYLDALIAATAEWMRVLKPSGSIFVNLGDKYDKRKSLGMLPNRYAIRCIDELALIVRAEIVWSKTNGLPESVTDRVRRSHEQVFHFVKQPRYYSAIDEVREPSTSMSPEHDARRRQRATDARLDLAGGGRTSTMNPLGKLPGSVWSIPTVPLKVPDELGVAHFAAYPPELVRRIILGWSPREGIVLDPFGGTGTTALVASVHGRVGISNDLSADYCRLARWRTTDEKQRARAAQAPKPKRPPSPNSARTKPAPKVATPENLIPLFADDRIPV